MGARLNRFQFLSCGSFKLVHPSPGRSALDLNLNGYRKTGNWRLHILSNKVAGFINSVVWDLQQDRIVNSQEQPKVVRQGAMQPREHQFQQIGGGALNDRVDGLPLRLGNGD